MALKCVGLIETLGLAAAVEAADTAVKSANVKLIGYEYTKGDGMCTVKVEGDVGAVKAAIAAATVSASKVWGVYGTKVIARPAEGIDMLLHNASETIGYEAPTTLPEVVEEVEEPKEEPEPETIQGETEEVKPEPTEENIKVTESESIEKKIESVLVEEKEEVKPIEERAEAKSKEIGPVEEVELERPVEDEVIVEDSKESESEEIPAEPEKKSSRRRNNGRRYNGKKQNPKGNHDPKKE